MLVFGTGRGVYDPLLKDFAYAANARYVNYEKSVASHEMTNWFFNYEQWLIRREDISVFGILRGTGHLIKAAEANDIDYYFWDHGYFGAEPNSTKGRYRCIKNGRHIRKIEDCQPRHSIPAIKPRYKDGSKILICPSVAETSSFYMSDFNGWLKTLIETLQEYTDRDIVVRQKGSSESLEEQLKDTHCMITTQSTVMIDALVNGIPCIQSSYGPGVEVCSTDISTVENPYYPDQDLIYKWLCTMDNYSFNSEEIKNGYAWGRLNGSW